MRYRFSNRASVLITATCNSTDTSVQLETGAGLKMPALSGDDIFRATMIAIDGTREIVNCTAVVGDVVTIVRGQEGTPASTFASGSRFEIRLTAGVAENFLQKSGDVMAGDLDMAGHNIQRAAFDGPQTFTNIHVQLIRSVATPIDQPFSSAENSISIPLDTSVGIEARRPRYMGRPILNAQMFDGIIMQWNGNVNAVPPHFKLCNGSGGTPDLRGKFIRGWSTTFGVGSTGGAETYNSSDAGAHDHGGATERHALTIAEMPVHSHNVPSVAGGGGTESTGNLGTGGRQSDPAGSGHSHAHGIPSQVAHRHVTNAIPPYFAVAYVQIAV